MIGISIDYDIDVMKLEKSNRKLQKKGVKTHSIYMILVRKSYQMRNIDEESCEKSSILSRNWLVPTLTRT